MNMMINAYIYSYTYYTSWQPREAIFFWPRICHANTDPHSRKSGYGLLWGGGHLAARDAGLLSPIGGRAPPSPWVATVAGDHHRTSHPHTTQHTTLLQVQADLSYMSCGRISLRAFFML